MLAFWNLHAFALYFVKDRVLAFSLARVLRGASLLMAPALSHVALSIRERRPRYANLALALSYGIGIALVIANNFDLVVARIEPDSRGFRSVGGPLYHVFTALLVANVCLAIGYLTHEYLRGTSPQRRQQLRFWLVGAVIALPFGLTNLLPAYGVPVYPLGNVGSAVWAALVGYAIVRHRLMDIDVVVTKGMAYAAVAFVLVAPAFVIILWLERVSFGHVHPNFSAAVLAMLIAVGVLFPALRFRAESRIERSLFREKHEYRAALGAFTRSIVRILDRDRLLRELATTLQDTLRLDRVAIALLDDSARAYTVRYALGPVSHTQEIPEGHDLAATLVAHQGAVMRDELESSSDATERTVVADFCRQHGWEVCIPLTGGGTLIGFISLGRKRNLDAFSAGDIELLETLAAQASVALENARLYEELGKSQEIIRRADRLSALGTLAAGIAHEVRNPLVSIQTFFQLAPERLHDEEFMTTFLGMTADEVKRIAALINELLSFARSPSRSLQPVDLNDSLARVVALLEPEARTHQLTLGCALSPDRVYASADADQLKQVLINLVLNAIQATPAGGSVSVSTRAVQHRQVAFGQIEIRDTGSGIRADRIDHIFDPFFTTKDKGTGLGLAIAHQIIAEHGGSISVESKEGQGTSFVVDLPACGGSDAMSYPSDGRIDVEPVSPRYGRVHKVAS